MVAVPTLKVEDTTAAGERIQPEHTTAGVPQPEFSIDFPREEENGNGDEFLVTKHTDETFQVKAANIEEAMAKVLASEHSSDVVKLSSQITVDCDSEYQDEDDELADD